MVAKFWKSQRSKIFQALAKQTCWQDKLAGVSWRVDVKTKSKDTPEVRRAGRYCVAPAQLRARVRPDLLM